MLYRYRPVIRVASLIVATLFVVHPSSSLAQGKTLDAAQVLKELGFPDDARAKLEAGQIVKSSVKSSNERELTAAMAFLVKVPPKQLVDQLQGGLLISIDENTIKYGSINGKISDLSGLSLAPDADKRAKGYTNAKAGSDLNLSEAEIKAFNALEGKPLAAVEEQVRKSVFARYQAYKAKGLAGIAPYARGDGKLRDAGGDLRSASKASAGLKRHMPDFYKLLNDYPAGGKPTTETFHWTTYKAHGEPVILLTHAFSMTEGEAFAVCQRQFYVSSSYNVEQAVAAFLPVPKGTLVVYANRTSTDQVAGFGGGAKRSMGGKILASQLESLFEDLQKAAP
jgi:hypothetical protein